MRIISQDGTYDFPYEGCTLFIGERGILATPIGEPETDVMMATYSSKDKMQYVIHSLHRIYAGLTVEDNECSTFIKAASGSIDILGRMTVKNPNLVFQFPDENELKMSDNDIHNENN